MFSKKKYIAVVTIILTLLTFSITYAANTTINTGDGQVDPNWSAGSALRSDGDDPVDDSTELRGYNAPTAVTLANLTTGSGTNIWAFMGVLTGMVLLLTGSIWVIKRLLKPPDSN